jgi:cytochrome c biogenesis protein CcmG/thiol:disulfide interchange protein DsbE
MKMLKQALPFFAFLLIVALLWRALSLHPSQVPSPLINKSAPEFTLPNLLEPMQISTNKDFIGHVTILNVWATWCYACAQEHAELLNIANNNKVILYGLNYKDDPEAAREWLKKNGNPYQTVAVDRSGETAINWGVYGTPETFVIDKKGMIRYKHIGPITADVWEEKLQPMVQQLQDEPL